MKVGKYNAPTPLVIGGVAGVGILILGQRLRGGGTPAAVPAAAVPSDGGGTGTSDLWGSSEVGQFPSFVPAVPDAGTSPGGGYGWWDPSAPPAPPPPINGVPPVPDPVTTPISPGAQPVPLPILPPTPGPGAAPVPAARSWAPAAMGAPPASATGAIVVRGATYRFYSVVGGKITGYRDVPVGAFSAWTAARATYPWPSQNSQRILVRIISGGHQGNYFSPLQTGVTPYTRA